MRLEVIGWSRTRKWGGGDLSFLTGKRHRYFKIERHTYVYNLCAELICKSRYYNYYYYCYTFIIPPFLYISTTTCETFLRIALLATIIIVYNLRDSYLSPYLKAALTPKTQNPKNQPVVSFTAWINDNKMHWYTIRKSRAIIIYTFLE